MANYHHYNKSGKIKTDLGTLTFDNLTDDLKALCTKGNANGITGAAPEVVGKTAVGKKDILALKIGKDPSVRVLLMGCHHAREWISVEVPFLVGKYLIDNYDPAAATPKAKRIKYLVDNAEIWVLPILNVDGHLKTFQAGEAMWRPNINVVPFPKDVDIERWVEAAPFHKKPHPKFPTIELRYHRLQPKGTGNKKILTVKKKMPGYEGVDLNRNYPVPAGPAGKSPQWGTETCGQTAANPGGFVQAFDMSKPPAKLVGEFWDLTTAQSPDPPDTYCGPSAGSEPEVDVVVKLIAKGNFKTMISYHNYGQVVLFPDDASGDAGVQFLGKGMEDLFKDRKAAYSYESGSGLYPTSGDTMEWAYRVHTLPNYTIEVSPTEADADKNDWGFNKLPAAKIIPTFEDNLPAALASINCAISGLKPGPMAAAPAPPAINVVQQCWKALLGWTP
jgi:hypothetical protein